VSVGVGGSERGGKLAVSVGVDRAERVASWRAGTGQVRRMAWWGESQKGGGRHPARFDIGSTSGRSSIPSDSAMNWRRVVTRCHRPG
jgi:hypothetical protein